MRSWARPADVAPGSGVADQMDQMESFVAGNVSGSEFARSWLAARRRSLHSGERMREPFERLLDRVFFDIEDYPIDPMLRVDGDITDEELLANVREVLSEIKAL